MCGGGKILIRSLPWRNGGKHLESLNLNKTIHTYIINPALKAPERIRCLKRSAWRGTQPCSYTCVIKCVTVSVFEFTVNEATTSSYVLWCVEVKARGMLVIAVVLMLTITEVIASNWFQQ